MAQKVCLFYDQSSLGNPLINASFGTFSSKLGNHLSQRCVCADPKKIEFGLNFAKEVLEGIFKDSLHLE